MTAYSVRTVITLIIEVKRARQSQKTCPRVTQLDIKGPDSGPYSILRRGSRYIWLGGLWSKKFLLLTRAVNT